MFAGYAAARREEKTENLIFRAYVSDSLQILSRELAGKYIEKRFLNLLAPEKNREEPEKNGEQIIKEVVERAGLVVINANEFI